MSGGPLQGIRVIDFSAVVSGPFACMWMADQGADVIKVETPGTGDITRGMAVGPDHHGLEGLYINCNRGKRSITIDVESERGRALMLDLCRTADVLVQNWRPGVVERLGLGYDDVRAVNPGIIYVSISGYGPDGPYANRRVYDPIMQGLSGHAAVQLNPDIPFIDLVRTIVCDKSTALTAAQSVCAALLARERGVAGGQHLVIPMLDTAVSFFFPDGYMAKARLDDELADERSTLAKVYRIVRTANGSLTYFVASQKEFEALFRALGREDWLDDPRFGTPAGRVGSLLDLGEAIIEEFGKWDQAEICARLHEHEVAFGPVLSLDEVPHDPQIVHNDIFKIREYPRVGRVLEPRHPVRFSDTPAPTTPMSPLLGQHTDEVLAELGRSADEIAGLRAEGITS